MDVKSQKRSKLKVLFTQVLQNSNTNLLDSAIHLAFDITHNLPAVKHEKSSSEPNSHPIQLKLVFVIHETYKFTHSFIRVAFGKLLKQFSGLKSFASSALCC
jgi:hypothetical protein